MGYALVVRHAQSTWNAEGRWQGQADPPLSDLGVQQAALAGEKLAGWAGLDMVVTSDLHRALRTAEILARAAGFDGPVVVETGLREYDVGRWSGLTREEICARWSDELERFGRGELPAPPGGEDRDDFDRRVLSAAAHVAAQAIASAARQLLVVCHGGVIRALARSQGVEEYRAPQLAGYHAEILVGTILPTQPVDLLDPYTAPPRGRPPGDPDSVAL